jgi:hypothetical protein
MIIHIDYQLFVVNVMRNRYLILVWPNGTIGQ